MSGPLSDDEVRVEMNKMVAFIRQEALEKAREIKVKADEEFAIEKAKLVHQEQHNIDALYERKRHGVDVAQKISQSTQTNKSRLKLLQKREELLQDLFSAAHDTLTELQKDKGRYTQLFEGIILQGVLQQLEPSVTVHARKKDVELVQRAADGATAQYKEMSGRDVEITVEGSLPDSSSGGVKLVSGTRRITIDNTLDERLRLLEDRMLPEIRHDLFGPNENRKFYT